MNGTSDGEVGPGAAKDLARVSAPESARRAEGAPFRPVQYLGSKMRLLPDIQEALEDVGSGRSGPVCDLFSGSGVVAHTLGRHGDVVAVDIQEYARVLASGALSGSEGRDGILDEVLLRARTGRHLEALTDALAPLIALEAQCLAEAGLGHPERLDDFIEGASLTRFAEDANAVPAWIAPTLAEAQRRLDRLPPTSRRRTLITRLFGGAYFSFRQAIALDALRQSVEGAEPGGERDLCLGALLSAASNAVNTVGKQFAQPIRLRKKDATFRRVLVEHTLNDRAADVLDTYAAWGARWREASKGTAGRRHHVVRSDYGEFLSGWSGPVRAFYADPPYTIDHYSRFYHVLETICLYDEPELSRMRWKGVPRIMRGLYRADRHQSVFCIPSTVGEAFRRLFELLVRFEAPLVLSYSPDRSEGSQRPRLLDLPSLRELASRSFRHVEVVTVEDHAHRKLNAEANNVAPTSNAEVLLVCRS